MAARSMCRCPYCGTMIAPSRLTCNGCADLPVVDPDPPRSIMLKVISRRAARAARGLQAAREQVN